MSAFDHVEELLRIVNEEYPQSSIADEHLRFELYRRALSLATSRDIAAIVDLIFRDPDVAMVCSAVVRHVDALVDSTMSGENASRRLSELAGNIPADPFLRVRLREALLLVRGRNQLTPGDSREVIQNGSDWLQRRVGMTTNDREMLRMLAESGRTKRIRHLAGLRLAKGAEGS